MERVGKHEGGSKRQVGIWPPWVCLYFMRRLPKKRQIGTELRPLPFIYYVSSHFKKTLFTDSLFCKELDKVSLFHEIGGKKWYKSQFIDEGEERGQASVKQGKPLKNSG